MAIAKFIFKPDKPAKLRQNRKTVSYLGSRIRFTKYTFQLIKRYNPAITDYDFFQKPGIFLGQHNVFCFHIEPLSKVLTDNSIH